MAIFIVLSADYFFMVRGYKPCRHGLRSYHRQKITKSKIQATTKPTESVHLLAPRPYYEKIHIYKKHLQKINNASTLEHENTEKKEYQVGCRPEMKKISKNAEATRNIKT